jgi:phosphate acetyltransferase
LKSIELPEKTMRESHHVFERLIAQCETREAVSVAVAFPCDEVSLAGAVDAARDRLIVPVLVGPRAQILAAATAKG